MPNSLKIDPNELAESTSQPPVSARHNTFLTVKLFLIGGGVLAFLWFIDQMVTK